MVRAMEISNRHSGAVFRTEGSRMILRIDHRIEFGSLAAQFDNFTRELLMPEISKIEVDLSRIDYLDSAVLPLFRVLHEMATSAGKGRMAFTGCTRIVREALVVAQFDRIFTINEGACP